MNCATTLLAAAPPSFSGMYATRRREELNCTTFHSPKENGYFCFKQIDMDITWLPKQDNFVEGSIGDITFFIKLKKVGIFTSQALGIELKEGEREKEIVDSIYIIDKNREERTRTEKVMAHEHEAYTVEEMKIVATLLYHNSLSNQKLIIFT